MAEHPIQGLMNVTMEKIHQMVDSNTIIGKPITTEDGITILPVSKVSFGFASGGTDFNGKNAANKDLFGGGSGAGVNIQPVAFLVIKDGCVRTIQLSDGNSTYTKKLAQSQLYQQGSRLYRYTWVLDDLTRDSTRFYAQTGGKLLCGVPITVTLTASSDDPLVDQVSVSAVTNGLFDDRTD